MTSNKRGGKRTGAGRKPLLTDFERLGVGGQVEARLRQAQEAGVVDKATAQYDKKDIKAKWAAINESRIENRKALKKNLLNDDSPLAESLLDVRSVLRKPPKKVIGDHRLYGKRLQILKNVAAELSRKHGRRVAWRYVERCLEMHRAFKKAFP